MSIDNPNFQTSGEVVECFGCETSFIAQSGEEFCSDECAASFENTLRESAARAQEIGLLDKDGNAVITNETTFTPNDLNKLTQKFNIRIK